MKINKGQGHKIKPLTLDDVIDAVVMLADPQLARVARLRIMEGRRKQR